MVMGKFKCIPKVFIFMLPHFSRKHVLRTRYLYPLENALFLENRNFVQNAVCTHHFKVRAETTNVIIAVPRPPHIGRLAY